MAISYRNMGLLDKYLKRFPPNHQPAAFEYLVANAFSQILFLPFQSKKTDDARIIHRVLWPGEFSAKKKIIKKSPSGSDAVCYAFGFYILVECTLKDGANQWRGEFVESMRHYEDFANRNSVNKDNLYLALMAKKLHHDTFMALHQKAIEEYRILLLEPDCLAKIWLYSKVAFTSRHLDFRVLMNELFENLRSSTSLDQYRQETGALVIRWGKCILKNEREVFFGLKSLDAMNKIGRNTVGTSEILIKLQRDRSCKFYIDNLGHLDLTAQIKEGLLHEKFAHLITAPNESLFCRVESPDYRARSTRLIEKVEEIIG